jgi:AcrR family transcriptional regulator
VSPSSEPARPRILAAAEELFAEHGYDRTSTARIARAAGVPSSLVFYHFATKEELLLSLLRERADSTLAALELPAPSGDLHAVIADLWIRLRAHLAPPSRMHRIVMRERDNHPALHEHSRRFETETVERMAGHLAAATGAGSATDEHAVAARLLFTAAAAIEDADRLDPATVARVLVTGLGAGH